MQLGELQSQRARFTNRGANIVALSVDPPSHSRSMIRRLGLEYPLASDEDQKVQKNYRVQNPKTRELALHAVFIIDDEQRIIYRKVASRRPKSQELLDAIDHYQGNYPLSDKAMNYAGTNVAFPVNDFQALIELATNSVLPESIDAQSLAPVIDLFSQGQLDDATIAYRKVMQSLASNHSEQQLLAAAAWFTRTVVDLPEEAMLSGRALNQALVAERKLRNDTQPEALEIEAVQKDLSTLRAVIRSNAVGWRLRAAKTTLRGYRELSLAAIR